MEENITKGSGKVVLRIFDRYFEFDNISKCLKYLKMPFHNYRYYKEYDKWPYWWHIYKIDELSNDIEFSDISLIKD